MMLKEQIEEEEAYDQIGELEVLNGFFKVSRRSRRGINGLVRREGWLGLVCFFDVENMMSITGFMKETFLF